jgi:hypothetical protein
MKHLISFDPGKSTGIALGTYSEVEPYELVQVWQTQNGLSGVLDWLGEHYGMYDEHAVSESFILRKTPFMPDVEPLRIEGALTVMYPDIVWQQPSDKHHVPDNILKKHGMWQTGKKLNHVDGRDGNDAIIHGITFLKKLGHVPTIKKYWGNGS